LREPTITETIEIPVNFIVHSLQGISDKLARGNPFPSDIACGGIMLYEHEGHRLAKPKPLVKRPWLFQSVVSTFRSSVCFCYVLSQRWEV
jgi:hypothetical protein